MWIRCPQSEPELWRSGTRAWQEPGAWGRVAGVVSGRLPRALLWLSDNPVRVSRGPGARAGAFPRLHQPAPGTDG